ncbi:hypothetical protein ANO11243_081430 [Dothideomycetidae sp. 11243]|nr:hypothetical protein ANO11243_081430 [fungal sp. No.11243]
MDNTPPPARARFFYASPLAIDDPLSPVPPPSSGASVSSKLIPRPFSKYDNIRLERAWLDLRKKTFKQEKEPKSTPGKASGDESRHKNLQVAAEIVNRDRSQDRSARSSAAAASWPEQAQAPSAHQSNLRQGRERAPTIDSLLNAEAEVPSTTGTPFIRAPSRKDVSIGRAGRDASTARPKPQPLDSYKWDEDPALTSPIASKMPETVTPMRTALSSMVAVGVSRLHQVVMPDLNMEPIYWSPVNDIAAVVRATWFYRDTMLPVEVPVANMLEFGYQELQVWSQTWQDELDSAVNVGAAGEERILRKLWPEAHVPAADSRPGTSKGEVTSNLQSGSDFRKSSLIHPRHCARNSPDGPDSRASGAIIGGRYGTPRTYATAGVIYTSATEAHVLKPSLQPSSYYGRRPLASYIRKGRKLGIPVVRGFDQAVWEKLYPTPKTSKAAKAHAGVSASAAGVSTDVRQVEDPQLEASINPTVTDLILVIHGIGQKLSERMESFHFTHAMNAFRRELNVELGSDTVRKRLRKDAGGIMLLPVNWRQTLTFEEGGFRSDTDGGENLYGLKDITPDTLSSVRNIVSDVMLDIPYYLSHHQPKMIAAVIREANRIYKLWCANNPAFHRTGRVHIIAHSLGSVMALDVLSNQPTTIPVHLSDPTKVDVENKQLDHFLFSVSNLFFAGSPSGFFLLLKRAALRPRVDYDMANRDPDANTSAICGERGDYGCLPVANIYNIINPYDPVSYRLNATVDATHAASLKSAWLPAASPGWFGSTSDDTTKTDVVSNSKSRPTGAMRLDSATTPGSSSTVLPRLPSNVELATHDFSREEIAEKRMYALNENGQIDYQIKYGGGPLEIQYLTMLGAHSSYWLLKDFVRTVVIECGRERGRQGTLRSMRAAKKKVM